MKMVHGSMVVDKKIDIKMHYGQLTYIGGLCGGHSFGSVSWSKLTKKHELYIIII